VTIKVVKPGMLSQLQDRGRYGYQQYGVIVSGAMDSLAHQAASLLVGNDGEATLEMTMLGPTLHFEEEALIAICGGDLQARIGDEPLPMWRPIVVPEDSTLVFGTAQVGCRAYLAVAGGFDVPQVMGSYATYARAGIGGYDGRALRAGDRLACKPPSAVGARMLERLRATADGAAPFTAARWSLSREMIPAYVEHPVIRITAGPQLSLLGEESQRALLTETYRISPQSDRMGYRLEGVPLRLTAPLEMLSEPVAFGTVQVPPDGQPIVLMADRQTTGGYPKAAQVVSADLPLLAQARAGSEISFRMVDLQEAQESLLLMELSLGAARQRIRMFVED